MQDLVLDGSAGESGGQILRTALALSIVTGTPFSIERIRAGRDKPGLLRQHLTAVQAAKEVGNAAVEGAALGARSLRFAPGGCTHGARTFAVGTAGSALLVLQTILPPLLVTPGRSRVVVEGGTHARSAPPWPFVACAFFPLLRRMGAVVTGELERAGFYPAGGGRIVVDVEGDAPLRPLELLARGGIEARRATAVVSKLARTIAEREIAVLRAALDLAGDEVDVVEAPSPGPGNAVFVEVRAAHAVEVFTAFGERGRRAEDVASSLVDDVRAWIDADVPVGEHLCDQLLIPLALAGGGTFRTVAPTPHTTTNAAVIERFLPVRVAIVDEGAGAWRVDVRPR